MNKESRLAELRAQKKADLHLDVDAVVVTSAFIDEAVKGILRHPQMGLNSVQIRNIMFKIRPRITDLASHLLLDVKAEKGV